jgi:hypothetical protein
LALGGGPQGRAIADALPEPVEVGVPAAAAATRGEPSRRRRLDLVLLVQPPEDLRRGGVDDRRGQRAAQQHVAVFGHGGLQGRGAARASMRHQLAQQRRRDLAALDARPPH